MMCERCWADAYARAFGRSDTDQTTEYRKLILERAEAPCSPLEQAGQFWDQDKQQDARRAPAMLAMLRNSHK